MTFPNYYRGVPIKENGDTDEPVSHVGVYVLHWRNHPAQPEIAIIHTNAVELLVSHVLRMKRLLSSDGEHAVGRTDDSPMMNGERLMFYELFRDIEEAIALVKGEQYETISTEAE